jgi:hypothetical protein
VRNGILSPHIFSTEVSVPEASVFGVCRESTSRPMNIAFNIHNVFGCITSDTMTMLITDCIAVDLCDRPSSLVDCHAMDGLTLDPLKYWQYQDKEDELGDLLILMISCLAYTKEGSYRMNSHLKAADNNQPNCICQCYLS